MPLFALAFSYDSKVALVSSSGPEGLHGAANWPALSYGFSKERTVAGCQVPKREIDKSTTLENDLPEGQRTMHAHKGDVQSWNVTPEEMELIFPVCLFVCLFVCL